MDGQTKKRAPPTEIVFHDTSSLRNTVSDSEFYAVSNLQISDLDTDAADVAQLFIKT